MKLGKIATAAIGITAVLALPLAASGAAVAANDKPERIEKSYKKYEPMPDECDPEVLAETGTCLILY